MVVVLVCPGDGEEEERDPDVLVHDRESRAWAAYPVARTYVEKENLTSSISSGQYGIGTLALNALNWLWLARSSSGV